LRAVMRLVLRPLVWWARSTQTSPFSMSVLLCTVAGGGALLGYGALRRWRRSRFLF
jgi:hypothetical protein